MLLCIHLKEKQIMPTTMKGVLRECKVTRADVEEGREEGERVVII